MISRRPPADLRDRPVVGSSAIVRLPDLPELSARVRWSECSQAGLVFETPIPMQVIAEWLDGRLRVSA